MNVEENSFNKKTIDYIESGKELLDFVEPLWKKLNNHHMQNSIDFKKRFENFNFKDRREVIEKNKDKQVFITLAKDMIQGKYIGYVIASISKESIGEIDSIYIEDNYRGLKIGDTLMKNSLDWIRNNGVIRIKIGVASGNEESFKFYARYGFFPRTTILEYI
ncbi:GNAT family N-acetyltransferase [Senegalia massiliensis]|uniref:GNAT family N-acetyltransferase n=1 Tax=Senegalia massiliensis TaxID=1720316 RepID=A0A845QUX5_9CLOT|nr:GNAT family N-acetyltransferase [Senegalia massiliensis]NBI05599.1 GNAT family N-acetyltransferase [Senegalia massiliensis]